MGKIFGITSGKGGVGKSTFSIGLASAFCSLGKEVLLVDMDEGLRCLDLMLGVNGDTVFDLADLLLDKKIPLLTGLKKVSPDEVMLKPELIENRN